MRRGERMGHWREVRLWEVRTAEYVCLTSGTYIHREVQKKVMWFY